jgi:hypothetical protein
MFCESYFPCLNYTLSVIKIKGIAILRRMSLFGVTVDEGGKRGFAYAADACEGDRGDAWFG